MTKTTQKTVFIIFILLFSFRPKVITGQVVDFNQVVPAVGNTARTFEDYMVQLAWANNPSNHAMEVKKLIEEKNIDILKKDWTKDMKVTFNLNEVSLYNVLHQSPDNIVLYPLYSFSAAINLGTFLQNPRKQELYELKARAAGDAVNQRKLAIRALVLKRYQAYLLAIEVLKARRQAEEDAHTNYRLSSDLFNRNKITLEAFNEASKSYFKLKEERLTAETDIQLAIIELEEILGAKWATVQKKKAYYDKKKKRH